MRHRVPLGDPVSRAVAWDAVLRAHPSRQQGGVAAWESGSAFLALADALLPSMPEGGAVRAVVVLSVSPGALEGEVGGAVAAAVGAGEEGRRRLVVQRVCFVDEAVAEVWLEGEGAGDAAERARGMAMRKGSDLRQ